MPTWATVNTVVSSTLSINSEDKQLDGQTHTFKVSLDDGTVSDSYLLNILFTIKPLIKVNSGAPASDGIEQFEEI
jgi:hypothetical protein